MIKKIFPILVIVGILVAFYFLTSKKPDSIIPTPTPVPTPISNLVLFYGSSCPHCKVVEEFISSNQIDQKIEISQLEVYDNKSNATVFSDMVKEICPDQLSSGGLVVPFLVDQKENQCIVGDTTITDYLSEKSK